MAKKDEQKQDSAVAERPEAQVATFDFGADANRGFENQTREDIVLPFISVLQALSPQVDKKPGEGGIAGARAGMLFNTVTEELHDGEQGIVFIPCHTEHVFVEWVPRKAGGGFVGVHKVDSPIVEESKKNAKDFGRYSTSYAEQTGEPSGNDLVETFYVYGLLEDSGVPVVIAFTSTKISQYKRWNTKLNMFQVPGPGGTKVRPPLFAHRVRLGTVGQRNSEGSFHNFTLAPAKDGDMLASLIAPDDPRYKTARETRELIIKGMARIAYETGSSEPAAEGGATTKDGKTIPF